MKCTHDGGRSIGAGHDCRCTGEAGHELFYGKYHGCECGAIWEDDK